MAYVPGFSADVFVSYSRKDNLPVDGVPWVTAFQERLTRRLAQLLGSDALVWRDVRLDGMEEFPQALDEALRSSALLLAIVSPGYRASSWCERERTAFTEACRKRNAERIGRRGRVVKAVKTPVDRDWHRSGLLPATLTYEFFAEDTQSQRFREFDLGGGEFTARFEILAQDIAAALAEMRRRRTIWLRRDAAGGAAWRDRESLLLELRSRGRRVVPDDEPHTAVEVRPAAGDAGLAIHLFPTATAHGLGSIDERVDWNDVLAPAADGVPTLVAVADASPAVEAAVLRALAAPRVDVLLNKHLEAIKDIVLNQIERVWIDGDDPGRAPGRSSLSPRRADAAPAASTPPPGGDGAEGLLRIYLVWDDSDDPIDARNAASDVRDYLDALGFEVKLPVGRDAGVRERRADNREKLKQADAVVLYWGNTSQAWLDARLRELAQALGWRHAQPYRARATYVSSPVSPYKDRFRTREVEVLVKQFDRFTPSDLDDFVRLLRAPGGRP